MHKNCGNGTSALVKTSFDDSTLCTAVGVGFELFHVGNQGYHFEQFVNILIELSRNWHADCAAAPFFGHEFIFGEFLLYAVGVGTLFVDFVDGNNDGDTGSLSMVDSFNCLRHDAVIGCNN